MSRKSGSKWVWPLAVVAIGALYILTKSSGATPSPATENAQQIGDGRQSGSQQSDGDGSAAAGGMELPATPTGSQWQILKRTGYTVAYDKATKLPRWVAWHLTADHADGDFNRDGLKFVYDRDVPEPRATDSDYSHSGYDHGHMCPSGDNKWSREAQVQTFLYTNCCPQVHELNAGDWNDIEQRCRSWATTFGGVYIVCGPILDSGASRKTIGRNKVAVPERFFKVVLRLGDSRSTTKAIGFICKNGQGKNRIADLVRTVDEVEETTVLDFFPQLPDDVEAEVESEASLSDWSSRGRANSR